MPTNSILNNKTALRKAILQSDSIKDALIFLGLKPAGGNYQQFKKACQKFDFQIPYSKNFRNTSKAIQHNTLPLQTILVKNSTYNRTHLKERLYKEGLKERKCELCGQNENWKGQKISLVLDHINGINNDNRLENLRVICPNCNAALETHCGKGKLQVCPGCQESKIFSTKQKYCNLACEKTNSKTISTNDRKFSFQIYKTTFNERAEKIDIQNRDCLVFFVNQQLTLRELAQIFQCTSINIEYHLRKHNLQTYGQQKQKYNKEKSNFHNCNQCHKNLIIKSRKFCNQCLRNIKRPVMIREEQRKVKRPPYEILKQEIQDNGYSAIGRKYGVSDNAIRKWVKQYQKEIDIQEEIKFDMSKNYSKVLLSDKELFELTSKGYGYKKISKITGKSIKSIKSQMKRLNLKPNGGINQHC